jgi:hypothetical protein
MYMATANDTPPTAETTALGEFSYSLRLLQPFARLLLQTPAFRHATIEQRLPFKPDERVPVEVAHQLLESLVAFTNDADIGLKAGRAMTPGNAGKRGTASQFHSFSVLRPVTQQRPWRADK